MLVFAGVKRVVLHTGSAHLADAAVCVFSLVDMAAKSIQQELQRRKSQEDAWNSSAIDLVRASDVSSHSGELYLILYCKQFRKMLLCIQLQC